MMVTVELCDEQIDLIVRNELLTTYNYLREDLDYITETGETKGVFDMDPMVDTIEISRMLECLYKVMDWYGVSDDLSEMQDEDEE